MTFGSTDSSRTSKTGRRPVKALTSGRRSSRAGHAGAPRTPNACCTRDSGRGHLEEVAAVSTAGMSTERGASNVSDTEAYEMEEHLPGLGTSTRQSLRRSNSTGNRLREPHVMSITVWVRGQPLSLRRTLAQDT
jgi:hypothetical protein